MNKTDGGFIESLNTLDGFVHQVWVAGGARKAMCGATPSVERFKPETQRCQECLELKRDKLARMTGADVHREQPDQPYRA